LESADHNVNNNSFSYIAINAIAGVEIKNLQEMEVKFPLTAPEKSNSRRFQHHRIFRKFF
jgi:anthranilate synthase component 1